MERWLAVTGFEGRYEVSDLGRVRSLQCKGAARNPPVVLKDQLVGKGYRGVRLFDGAVFVNRYVHRLVLTAFCGEPEPHMDGAHLDGVRTHNALANLTWATRAENHAHKRLHGTMVFGAACHQAKLTDEAVAEARTRWKPGTRAHGSRALAREFGVSQGHMRAVLGGRGWSHIPGRTIDEETFAKRFSLEGDENPHAKLTEAQVREARAAWKPRTPEGSSSALARKYGMSQGGMHAVLRGRSWSHLKNEEA